MVEEEEADQGTHLEAILCSKSWLYFTESVWGCLRVDRDLGRLNFFPPAVRWWDAGVSRKWLF